MGHNDEQKFNLIRPNEDLIHYDTKFGHNVTLGFGVVIDQNCEIGDRVFIGHNTVIRAGVKIGNDSTIGHLVVIEADTVIGEKVTIQSQCHVTKDARIDDRVFFGPMAMCINTRNISHGRTFKPRIQGPWIKFGAIIGSGAILMPGCEIGRNAVVGAGALVDGRVPDEKIYYSKSMVAQNQGTVTRGGILKDD